MSDGDGRRWSELADQALRDIDEVHAQLAAGEIDREIAARLLDRYQGELAEARDRMTSPAVEEPANGLSTRARTVVGAGILAVGVVVTMISFNALAEPDPDAARQGLALTESGEFDPAEYSDETLEAVIASAEGEPAVAAQLPYMRYALAERYFTRGDFQAAFGHYERILEAEPAPDLVAGSLTRLAWIVWTGNGETDLAISLLDRALDADPGFTETLYVKGQIVWCGLNDPASAVELFDRVLESELDDQTREQVQTDRNIASAGGSC